ncbi:MAG: methanethiol S-methyltransferase [Pseudolabrys sp.]
MARALAFLYGLFAYLVCLPTLIYAIGFVAGVGVPKTIDSGEPGSITTAIVVDMALMALFAVQHSVMARAGFKAWSARFVPKPVERSTYVLVASLCLALLCWQWRPLPDVVWTVAEPHAAAALIALGFVGWGIVLSSTFLISHFELFGLLQVVNNLVGLPMPSARFRTPLYYNFVRHPIYFGFIVAFWATPLMTTGHLLFAAVTTAYIFVGIVLEEGDLIDLFGDDYRSYRRRVAMIVPWRKSI